MRQRGDINEPVSIDYDLSAEGAFDRLYIPRRPCAVKCFRIFALDISIDPKGGCSMRCDSSYRKMLDGQQE
jgi:hypothetical protein